MKQERKSLRKDTRGFTGLEAAIVLTAFVVVAAVFSYMVLGAGFFSTEKAKAVVHTGVEQTTSSVELAGNVIGHADSEECNGLRNVTLYLQLTAGRTPVDMNKLGIAYTDKYVYNGSLVHSDDTAYDPQHVNTDNVTAPGTWDYAFVPDQTGNPGNGNNMLDADEKVKVFIWLPAEVGDGLGYVTVYNWFQVEVKPEKGGSIAIKKTVPGAIDDVMILYS
ncbi:MAG: flagellin [Methanophagales archaeon]|nr:flagellin [Methanophagales archaeon]